MKANILKTGSLVLLILLVFAGIAGAQEKMTRQEKKAARKVQLEQNFHVIDTLLMAKRFVLEADYLRTREGELIPVTSGLNFIKINQNHGVLQTGANAGLGYNGVGGVTAEGNVDDWKIFKNVKNLNFTVQFHVLTNIGNYDVVLNVNADNNASATITGLGPGNLTWQGHLYTLDSSRVFKGQNSY